MERQAWARQTLERQTYHFDRGLEQPLLAQLEQSVLALQLAAHHLADEPSTLKWRSC